MELIDAYKLACRLHTGQVDKAGRPYIEHLTRVMLRVQAAGGDLVQQVAALLHDSIEDGKASAEQLAWLGVPSGAIELVMVLSKPKGKGYEDYLEVVKRAHRALKVKFADLDDNEDPERLALLPDAVASRLREKYGKARSLLASNTGDSRESEE